jgi:microcompartment protein CcmK/EutM
VKIGRVVGTVVSTINAPAFDGRALLLCDLLDPAGTPAGGYVIAVDSVGAGAGETVLILDEGNSARQVLAAPGAPIRTVVVGIVDAVVEGPADVAEGPADVAEGPAAVAPATARPTTPAAERPTTPAAVRPARPRRRR